MWTNILFKKKKIELQITTQSFCKIKKKKNQFDPCCNKRKGRENIKLIKLKTQQI